MMHSYTGTPEYVALKIWPSGTDGIARLRNPDGETRASRRAAPNLTGTHFHTHVPRFFLGSVGYEGYRSYPL